MHFYGVAEPGKGHILGERPDAVTMIRRGRIERIHLGLGVLQGLIEIPYAQLPPQFRDALFRCFWRRNP
jgi:hypothetical protein